MKRIASFAVAAPFPAERRSDDAIAADAQRLGDTHKVATAISHEIEIYGITLKSRYAKLHELEAMVSVFDHLSALTVDALDSMLWDSKDGSSIFVSLRRNVPESELRGIARELSRWFEWATGGERYRIAVGQPDQTRCDLNPFSMDDEPAITARGSAGARPALPTSTDR